MKHLLRLIYLSLTLLTASASSLNAEPKVYHLALEASHIPHNRDFLFPEVTKWDYQARLLWDVGYGRFWMDNDITGRTYGSRFRYVAWEFTAGYRLAPGVDIIQYHKSQHAIDLDRKKFPVIDGYGIRLTFLQGKRP